MQSRNCHSKTNQHKLSKNMAKTINMQLRGPTQQCLNENHIDLARGQNGPKGESYT